MADARQLALASADTLPKLLLQIANGPHKGESALRQKELGRWRPLSWADYAGHVKETYLGLQALGFCDGDRAFFIAENSAELLYTDLAVQTFKGLMAGAFPESQGQEIVHLWDHSGARFALVGDQEQADKLLELDLPGLQRLIVIDNRGMASYTDARLTTFAALLRLGQQSGEEGSRAFETAVAAGKPTDPAALLYTSGTTAAPKGAVLSQASAVHAGKAMTEVLGLNAADEILSYLPYAWVGERMFTLFYALAARYKINFPEDSEIEVVLSNWREVMPSLPVAPARIWESLCSRVFVGIDNTTWLKRRIFQMLMPIGQRAANARLAQQKTAWWVRLLLPIADLVLFRWLRSHLGLSQARSAFTGGSALGPEVFTFFHSIGIELRQIYGQTESSGISVVHQGSRISANTVGEALPGMELRISETGEVLLRGPLVFSEYLNNPEATAATIQDGWLRTGDQGSLHDGQLVIMDRMKDVCCTTTGVDFSPQLLQNKLKFSRFIRDAVVVGHERAYVAALVQIDAENVGNWANRRGMSYTTFRDLSQRSEVRSLIQDEVAAVNRGLPNALRIQQFEILDKQLDADDDELTRTAKIRRANVERKYAHLIEQLYNRQDWAVSS